MKRFVCLSTAALLSQFVSVWPAAAQNAPADPASQPAPAGDDALARPIVIQHFRPVDQRGINMFETRVDLWTSGLLDDVDLRACLLLVSSSRLWRSRRRPDRLPTATWI